MRKIYFLFFILPVLFLAACNGGKNKFTVNGDIKNIPDQTVYLEELNINDVIVVLDSTETNKGRFELSASSPEPGLYRLRFEMNKQIILSIGKENVKISGDWATLENYNVTGSPASASLNGFMRILREHMSDFNTMGGLIQMFEQEGKDSMVQVVTEDMHKMNIEFTRYIEEYADTTQYLPNALFAVQMLNPAVEKDFMQAFIQSMNTRFPNATLAKDFTNKYNRMMDAANEPMPRMAGPAVGQQAPDLMLQDVNGKNVSLSAFRGKYVLLDFWASWCGPCRRENPNIVSAYNKFKNKNFTIVGISLDSDKDKWKDAIEDDKLTWTHLSDLKKWESAAAMTYAVEAIPTNFLLDPEGKIIARDLRADELQNKLQEVLK